MTAVEVFHELHAWDIRLKVDGDRLVYDAPEGTVTDEVLTLLRQHKTAFVALLQQGHVSPVDAGVLEVQTPANDVISCPNTHVPCTPAPTDGPLRQCQACPYCWYVACACGTASWTPDASWAPDGAGVVRWTCKKCGACYEADQVNTRNNPPMACPVAPHVESLEKGFPTPVWRCRHCGALVPIARLR